MEKSSNLLAVDGEAYLLRSCLKKHQADIYFEIFAANTPWQHDEVVLFGKTITTKRQVAWYGDEGKNYTYAGRTKEALPWTPRLEQLKAITEQHAGAKFNSCLLNYYHDGTQSMGYHRDNEKDLLPNGTIASLSLGASRRFLMKHKPSGEKVEVLLYHGDLLIMKGEMQTHWYHSLPKMLSVKDPRINLTFRCIQ